MAKSKSNNRNGKETLEISPEDYEEAVKRVYQDMMSRHKDIEVQQMRFDNQHHLFGVAPGLSLGRDAVNLAKVYRNFTSGKERVGEWDHKPVMKEIMPSFYRTDKINAQGKQPVVFGAKTPGDEEYLYDHDVLGNISYGYTMAAARYPDWVTDKGAELDDRLQWAKNSLLDNEKKSFDNGDKDMVQLGIDLYRKYGDKMTEEDFMREVQASKQNQRRYKLENLETRSVKAKDGENLAQVAARHGVSREDMVQNLRKDAKINPAYAGINENMSLKDGARVNLPQKADRNYAAMTERTPEQRQVTSLPEKPREKPEEENSIYEALQKHNNPKEDILYKPVEQITEGELKDGMRHYLYENNNSDRKKQADEVQGKWYDYFYGKDEVKRDEFGRQLEPQSKKRQPEEPSELRLGGQTPLTQAYEEVAKQAAPFGVKSLQRGLNSFEDGSSLKEDGVLGAKTTSRTKEALNRYGLDKVKKSIGYGGLSTSLEDNRQQPLEKEKLQQSMSAIRPDDGGSFLQKGLNQIGRDLPDYEVLKEDNDIGEKTTSAFNSLKENKEEEIKSYVRSDYASSSRRQMEDEPMEEDEEEI